MTYFGDYLREARGSKSLSQAAAVIGCTKAHLWELEKGRAYNPGLILLDGIARAYCIPLSCLAEAWEKEAKDGTARSPQPIREEPSLSTTKTTIGEAEGSGATVDSQRLLGLIAHYLHFSKSVILSGECWTATCQQDFADAMLAVSRLREQVADRDALRDALRPFAMMGAAGVPWEGGWPDARVADEPVGSYFKAADFKRAAEVLAKALGPSAADPEPAPLPIQMEE